MVDDSSESKDPLITEPTSAPAEQSGQALPEMSPALRRRLKMCHDHGLRLMQSEKYDFDYAHTLLSQCVIYDPGNVQFLDTFFENLKRKFKDTKPGGFGWGSGGNLRALLDKQQWVDALKAGIENLVQNPWDVMTLRGLAEACANLQLPETELRFLKQAIDKAPRDVELNRHCAKSLARMLQIDQAIACWHRVEEADKNDPEATKTIAELTLLKTRIATGNMPEGFVMPPKNPQRGAATKTETKKREIQLTPRQRLEQAIKERPEEPSLYCELAKILLAESRPADAVTRLMKALELSGGDLAVREQLEDAQVELARVQAALAEKRASVERTPEAEEAAERAKRDANRLELETLAARCDRYPDRRDLSFELALRIKRGGQLAEAIKYFTLAAGDAQLAAAAQLEVGECYQQLKQYKPAYEAFKAAILASNHYGKLATPEQRETRKLALYRGGVLAAALQKFDRAEQMLEALVKLDPAFKDGAARLDKVRQMRNKG